MPYSHFKEVYFKEGVATDTCMSTVDSSDCHDQGTPSFQEAFLASCRLMNLSNLLTQQEQPLRVGLTTP